MDTAIWVFSGVVAVAVGVLVLFVTRATRAGMRRVGAFVASQKPTRKLAEALLDEGRPVELRAVAVPGHLALWLEHDVTGDLGGNWTADVHFTWRAGAASGGERCTVGADSDGHLTPEGAKGVRWFPSDAPHRAARDQGTLNLAALPAAAGEPIEVQCTLHRAPATGPWTLRLYVGVAEAASVG